MILKTEKRKQKVHCDILSKFLKIIYEFGFNFYSRKMLFCYLFGLPKVGGIKSFLYEFCDKEINKIIKMEKKETV
jgi:hypothetical protein